MPRACSGNLACCSRPISCYMPRHAFHFQSLCHCGGRRRHTARCAQGNMACCSSPVSSGMPITTFRFWMACPDAPFTRLSMTAHKTSVSAATLVTLQHSSVNHPSLRRPFRLLYPHDTCDRFTYRPMPVHRLTAHDLHSNILQAQRLLGSHT